MSIKEHLKEIQEDWLRRVNEKWKGLYDYSKTVYLNMNTPVTIHCNKHNLDFVQLPRTHLMYSGCPKCYSENYSSNTEEFIEKAKQVHGDRYDYSKVKYEHCATPVTIICPEHGEFKQLPYEHMRGKGCGICVSSYGHKAADAFLRSLGIKFEKEFRFKEYLYKYDFYIPDVKLLIEVDGGFHRANGFSGFELEKQKEIDKFKDNLALINNMNLIRVDYESAKGTSGMIDELARLLRQHIKYIRDNKCYSNFGSYCQAYNLPGTTTPADCKEYSIDNIIARLLGD